MFLAVNKISEIHFIIDYDPNALAVPVKFLPPVVGFEVVGIVQVEVRARCQHLVLAHHLGYAREAVALRREPLDATYYLCGRLVNEQMMPAIRIELITERRL